MADVSGVDNQNSGINGSNALAGIKSAIDNLNTAKVETSVTVNGHALSGNVTVSSSDVGLPNVTNDAQLKASQLDTDGTLAANSDTRVASQKATKTFVAAQLATVTGVPTGGMLPYGGSSAPTGYLICDGSAVSRTTYAALFAVVASTFGSGDGSTTFNVPDMRGRVALGAGTGTGGGSSGSGLPTGGSALTARSVGNWLGEETHTLSTPEMPSHTHSVSVWATTASNTAGVQGNAATGSNGSVSAAATATGGGGSHNNIQPVMTFNFIIKT